MENTNSCWCCWCSYTCCALVLVSRCWFLGLMHIAFVWSILNRKCNPKPTMYDRSWVYGVCYAIFMFTMHMLQCLVLACDCCCPGPKPKPKRRPIRHDYKKDDGDEPQGEATSAEAQQQVRACVCVCARYACTESRAMSSCLEWVVCYRPCISWSVFCVSACVVPLDGAAGCTS